jgi:putative transposase
VTFWRTYYHIVWSTANRLPLITENIEIELYEYIKTKCHVLECPLHAIGGVSDHIHVVISIPPSIAVSEIVRRIKGSSSHFANRIESDRRSFPPVREGDSTFAWQREYGVFSLGGQQLDRAVSYVMNQKEHHAQGSIERFLEPDIIHPKS